VAKPSYFFQEKTRLRRQVGFPGTEEAAISRRADIRELGTERHSCEMIGFEATFLQPDNNVARAL